MLDLNVIEREIIDLEKRDTSYATVERLAWLYTVRDHNQSQIGTKETGALSGSEFLEACSNTDYTKLMGVLDEHMRAVYVVCRKEYDSVLAKIKALM